MKKQIEKPDAKEWALCIVAYAAISLLAAWLFYDSIAAALIFAPFFVLFIRAFCAYKKRRSNEELTDGFIRTLISVSTSLSAGMSAENAFLGAAADMEKLYGKRSQIVRQLGVINTQVGMGVRVCDALYDLAKRTGIQEIYDFAVVFDVASRKGADRTQVISSCVLVMENKRHTECEAQVLIRAKQYEQRVMCIIPPGILVYLRLSSGSFIDVLYHNPLGAAIMTACLIVYVLAICMSERIGDVKV